MPDETKIFYYIEDEKTPYAIKINISPDLITLGDFKAAIKKPNCKYFFRSQDQDFGVVKEEIVNDDCRLPLCDNRIVAWLVSPDPPENSSQSSSSGDRFQQNHDCVPNIDEGKKVTPGGRPTTFHHKRPDVRSNRYLFDDFGSRSTLDSTDVDTLSYNSRDDSSEYSTYSELTVSTRNHHRERRHRYRKKRPKPESETSSIYSSGITDSSMSLHIIDVTLNMDKYNFLGISIVGQSNDRGDGGIYIGSIMKGGAVAADGRIEPGDMLLQVNKINFENMSNEEAVRELRGIVHKPGPITLTIAKCWDPGADSNYFTIPKNEPVRPIDPAVWANNINAVQGCYSGNSAMFTAVHENSSDLASSLPESERYDKLPLSSNTDLPEVVRCMKMPDSGLDVKTRMWLKITIPQAFIGSDLVGWLQQKVEGLSERRDARKYASRLLKAGLIRHTVNKTTFSEQCYYVFGDYADAHRLPQGFSSLSLGDSNSDSRDSDPIAILPGFRAPLPQCVPTNPPLTVTTSSSKRDQPRNVPSTSRQSDVDSLSANGLSNSGSRADASMARRQLAFGGNGGSVSDNASESRLSVRSGVGSSGENRKSKSGSDKSYPVNQSLKGNICSNPSRKGPLPPAPRSDSLTNSFAFHGPRPTNKLTPADSGSRESFKRMQPNLNAYVNPF